MSQIDIAAAYRPSDKIIAREIEGEIIIVPVESGVVDIDDALYSLNETGMAVWKQLRTGTTISDICQCLSREYDAPFDEIESDVLLLLEELSALKLIVKA